MSQHTEPHVQHERLLTPTEAAARYSLSLRSWWRKVASDPTLPKAIRVSPRRPRWKESEINRHIASL